MGFSLQRAPFGYAPDSPQLCDFNRKFITLKIYNNFLQNLVKVSIMISYCRNAFEINYKNKILFQKRQEKEWKNDNNQAELLNQSEI